ncbi:MAG: NAD(P)/FAD-dependent oxidoreductase [Myxococcales bacterium]|nr:NAD(P)/FAD-dependent oxidoreductase [Myxococcales bacterium]
MDPSLEIECELELAEPDSEQHLRAKVARKLGIPLDQVPRLEVKRRAIDARRGHVRFHLTLGALEDSSLPMGGALPRAVSGDPVVIIGGGPAGLFCAYELARQGIASIVLDRGKQVQARRRDLKGLTQHGVINPDSNYCFGEGGAGTYSDGKLYTRSHKRGDVRDVMETLFLHGAPADILVDARPHIGSNRLPKVITALRERLEACGVQFRFEAKVASIAVHAATRAVQGVMVASGETLAASRVVVATGHSARDVFDIMLAIGAACEAKPFALGVRIEHPQPLIDQIQYGRAAGHPKLRAAPYKLVHTPPGDRGVFSFCMCPGGWIVPAATETDGLVVNGMSLSRRDSPFANSGLVVSVERQDFATAGLGDGVLAGVELQRMLERAALIAGGGMIKAPATRVTDFLAGRASTTLPRSSYEPGLTATNIADVLAATRLPIADKLRHALHIFGKQMRGYVTEEAVLVGVESRTSCPVRVLRDAESLQSPTVAGLYPCGEGAGYAGGIVSAALDGVRVAHRLSRG